jgi:hypothetical protein
VTGTWRKLHSKKLHKSDISLNIRSMNSRTWTRHVAHVTEMGGSTRDGDGSCTQNLKVREH